MTASFAPAACIGCGAPAPIRAAPVKGHQLWRCVACDLLFHEVRRSEDEHAALFDETYFAGSESDGYDDYLANERALRRQARTYLGWIERALGGPGRLFDAGCATGFLMDEGRRRGWIVSGCDPSAWASGVARDALALDVTTTAFDEVTAEAAAMLPHGTVDALTLVNVLEHCIAPQVAIQRAASGLRRGGILLVETWDRDSLIARVAGSRWHQWSPGRVVSWLNRPSLRALVPPSDWEWLRYSAVTRWISFARGLEVLGVRGTAPIGRVLLPYRMGDLVVLIARRR